MVDPAEIRSIKALKEPHLSTQPLCIVFPAIDEATAYELKSGLIHHLPSFHGKSGDDPHKHLNEIHVVCSSMKLNGVTEEQVKMRAFPFTLKDAAKDWLYYLPPNSITSWKQLKKAFLDDFFPATKSSNLKKQISNFEQEDGETMHEYWGRFKKLVASCPNHGYTDEDLILYFCGGLGPDDARMVNAVSGGGIINKTLTQAKELITELAESSRAFSRKGGKKVHDISSNSSLENKVQDLFSMMK